MASGLVPAAKRARLAADIYPQDPKQKEDELSADNLKKGFEFALSALPATLRDPLDKVRTRDPRPTPGSTCCTHYSPTPTTHLTHRS